MKSFGFSFLEGNFFLDQNNFRIYFFPKLIFNYFLNYFS